MQRFCIDASVIGANRHIIGDAEGYSWSDTVPRDAWHLTGKTKASSNVLCLDTLFRLVNHVPAEPPESQLAAFRSILTGSIQTPVPWMYALPQTTFRIFFKKLVQETLDIFPTLPFDYYTTAWQAGSRVLSRLRPAKIHVDEYRRLTSEQLTSAPVLESFCPKRSGFAHDVVYDRFGTRTGRLVVERGPNILHLKRDHRSVITSSFPEGSICSLDFRALEPRIVLAENGLYSSAPDLYEEIANRLLSGTVTRDIAKVSVISELYGVSRSTLRTKLKISDKKLDAFIDTIRSHFGIERLRARLKKDVCDLGKIRNKFGRPLPTASGQDNLLINTYAQSSGVDVALLGFDKILQDLGDSGIRPLFVLHDALILDVSPERMNDVKNINSVQVPYYDSAFPIKLEIFNL